MSTEQISEWNAKEAQELERLESTCDWFDRMDEYWERWSLRDEGRNPDGSGESYAERNV